MQKLPFYFDFISPYAYLAFTRIEAIAARHARELEPIPVLFAALLDDNGQLGPAEIPRKREYIFKDCVRLAAQLGAPFAPPKAHPFNPLLALRAASCELAPEDRLRLIRALYAAIWAESRDLTQEATLVEIASSLGLSGESLLAEAKSAPIKARVRERTNELLERGGFGVPSIWVDGELFWGVDSLAHVERRLLGADPIDAIDRSAWSAIGAQAIRRRVAT